MPNPTPHLQQVHAYVPGLQPQESGWIKLNTNENPFPPSPLVRQALLRELGADGDRLRLYPEPLSRPLRERLACIHRLDTSRVFVGNGSDEILKYFMWAFTDGARPACALEPSYSLYPVLAAICNSELRLLELDESMCFPLEALLAAEPNIIFITQPNAPTGVAFPLGQLRELAERTRALIVVDEAYAAFAREDALELVHAFDHVCISRTFSKSHSLAGMRVGYLLGSAEVVDILDRVRDAYNLDRLAQVAALAALEDETYYRNIISEIVQTREAFRAKLQAFGWFVYPSEANFLFAAPVNASGDSGAAVAHELYEYLRAQKILVRYFPDHPFTCRFLRITIGLPEQMNRLAEAIESWQQNA